MIASTTNAQSASTMITFPVGRSQKTSTRAAIAKHRELQHALVPVDPRANWAGAEASSLGAASQPGDTSAQRRTGSYRRHRGAGEECAQCDDQAQDQNRAQPEPQEPYECVVEGGCGIAVQHAERKRVEVDRPNEENPERQRDHAARQPEAGAQERPAMPLGHVDTERQQDQSHYWQPVPESH